MECSTVIISLYMLYSLKNLSVLSHPALFPPPPPPSMKCGVGRKILGYLSYLYPKQRGLGADFVLAFLELL